jgi:hypothetical protein
MFRRGALILFPNVLSASVDAGKISLPRTQHTFQKPCTPLEKEGADLAVNLRASVRFEPRQKNGPAAVVNSSYDTFLTRIVDLSRFKFLVRPEQLAENDRLTSRCSTAWRQRNLGYTVELAARNRLVETRSKPAVPIFAFGYGKRCELSARMTTAGS